MRSATSSSPAFRFVTSAAPPAERASRQRQKGALGLGYTLGVPAIAAIGSIISTASTEQAAYAAARQALSAAQANGATSGAAGSIATPGGVVVTDVSTSIAARTANLNLLLEKVIAQQARTRYASKFGYGCAEVGCLNQLLNAGVDTNGAVSVVVRVRPITNPKAEDILRACDSCKNLLALFGAR